MQTVNLQEEAARGREATMLLSHPILEKAFQDVHDSLMKTWFESPVRAAADREWLFTAVKLLAQVKGNIEAHVTTGKMATMQLLSEAPDVSH